MPSIFISHAGKDESFVQVICASLEAHGLQTWVSFRDIKPGTAWDKQIEEALLNCDSVAVICSATGVESSYVRAEVEEALRKNKTVIPIIIEECSLPIRWKLLQWVKWSDSAKEFSIQRIIEALPETALANFKLALEEPDGLDRIRPILSDHLEWLPIEHWMRPEYHVLYRTEVKGNFLVDVFAARMDSVGPRAFLYYFGAHNVEPFSSENQPCRDLSILGEMINWHILNIRKPLSRRHPMSPKNMFVSERDHWREIGDYYRTLNVYVLFGRRKHYSGIGNDQRRALVASLSQRWQRYAPPMEVNFEMMSYDRIVDSISRGVRIKAPQQL